MILIPELNSICVVCSMSWPRLMDYNRSDFSYLPGSVPGGATQFFVCCQPRILMLKLTPKQVFSSPKKETLSTFLSS